MVKTTSILQHSDFICTILLNTFKTYTQMHFDLCYQQLKQNNLFHTFWQSFCSPFPVIINEQFSVSFDHTFITINCFGDMPL